MQLIKTAAGILAALILSAGCVHTDAAGLEVPEGFYPQTFIVTEVLEGRDYDRITLKTVTGISFESYTDTGDYIPGDLVSALMYDMGTPEIEDDIILDTKYAGIAEWFVEIQPNEGYAPQEAIAWH